MVSDKKMGIVVILVILASICLCSYHVINDNVMDDKPTYKIDTLDAGNITNETPITTVNLNINQEVGGCQIKFADTDTIYSINTTNTNNSNDSMNVTHNINGDQLNMDVNSNKDEIITLSSKYHYNINAKCNVGGLSYDVSKNAHINELNSTITLGGCDIHLNGGVIDNINSQVTLGGVNIIGNMPGTLNVNSTIGIGGLNINQTKSDYNIHSNIDLGGVNMNTPNKQSTNQVFDFKTPNYDNSENKINLNSNIQLGGLNIG